VEKKIAHAAVGYMFGKSKANVGVIVGWLDGLGRRRFP
jgi:hypothetical protein